MAEVGLKSKLRRQRVRTTGKNPLKKKKTRIPTKLQEIKEGVWLHPNFPIFSDSLPLFLKSASGAKRGGDARWGL